MSKEVKCPRCGADIIADYDKLRGYCPYCKHEVWLEFDGMDNVLVAREYTKQAQEETRRAQEKTRRTSIRYAFLNQGCRRYFIIYLIGLAISVVFLVGAFAFDLFGDISHHFKGEIHPPMASYTITDGDHNYKDVVEAFKDAGFTNIKVSKDKDIVIGFFASEKTVKSVTISGHSEFSTDDWMLPDAMVRIVYHDK